MTHQQVLSRTILSVCLIFTCSLMNACDSTFTWKEEVLLHDGTKLIVERTDIYDSSMRHEIGQGPPLAEHRTKFVIPGTNQTVVWKSDNRSPSDPDRLHLLVLDFSESVPYVATTPFGSFSYQKWNRPNPPYVFFKYVGQWKRIPRDEFPDTFEINVIVTGRKKDTPKIFEANRTFGYVPADTVAEINREPGRSKEYYSLLREPLDYGPVRPEHKGPKAPDPIIPTAPTDGK